MIWPVQRCCAGFFVFYGYRKELIRGNLAPYRKFISLPLPPEKTTVRKQAWKRGEVMDEVSRQIFIPIGEYSALPEGWNRERNNDRFDERQRTKNK